MAKPSSMENSQTTSTEPSYKKQNAFWSAQILALSVFYLFFYVQTVHAGLFDVFIKKVEADDQGEKIPSSRLAVLSANAYDANLVKNAYNDIVTVSGDEALLPIVGPEGTALDIDGDYIPETDTISVYIVKKGDTITSIAKDFGVSTNTIIWANNLKKGQSLKEGTSLTILPITGVKYTVKKGDTISSIAKKLGADTEDIRDFNGIDNADLKIGMAIIVPDGEITTASTTTKIAQNTKPTNTEKPKTSILSKVASNITGKEVSNGVILANKGEKTWGYNAPEDVGYYTHPLPNGRKSQHIHGFNGLDFAAPKGTPIMAAAAGKVIIAKNSGYNGGYGLYVVIEHDNGTQTLYAHNSKNLVLVGDTVSQGQQIALVGSTGRSTGNHVHFEVRGAKNPF
jgi:murein DD-endopeptidase MepM/ murein hydrolase activator NlpD